MQLYQLSLLKLHGIYCKFQMKLYERVIWNIKTSFVIFGPLQIINLQLLVNRI